DLAVDRNVRSSDRGVYPILRYGKTSPGDVYDGSYTGPLLYLPEQPGWYYIEVADHLDLSLPTLMRTRINETVSSAVTVPYVHSGGAQYALAGHVTCEYKCALSDLVIDRIQCREFMTKNDPYIFESRCNVKAIGDTDPDTPVTYRRWGKTRFMYTLRDATKD